MPGKLNDAQGFYPDRTTISQDLRPELEAHLTAILRSKETAQQLTQRIFGSGQIHYIESAGQILRLWLTSGVETLGLTPDQTQALQAALELGHMVYVRQTQAQIIDDPAKAAKYFINHIGHKPQEQMAVLVLNIKHHVLGCEIISHGTATETLAHFREILHPVLRMGGSCFIVAHNHPSGSLEASPEDIQLTQQLLRSARCMGIPMLDHLIISGQEFRSLQETTSLWIEHPQTT